MRIDVFKRLLADDSGHEYFVRGRGLNKLQADIAVSRVGGQPSKSEVKFGPVMLFGGRSWHYAGREPLNFIQFGNYRNMRLLAINDSALTFRCAVRIDDTSVMVDVTYKQPDPTFHDVEVALADEDIRAAHHDPETLSVWDWAEITNKFRDAIMVDWDETLDLVLDNLDTPKLEED